jgi:N-formylglutamate deformylase
MVTTPQKPGIYTLHLPSQSGPVVVDSPHSGRVYPADFAYACDFDDLRRAEDLLLDEMLIDLPEHGVPVLNAEFPRSYIDVNRSVTDIDDHLFAARWPGAVDHAGRSNAGIGLVRRLLKPGVPIYAAHLTHDDVGRRIDGYYRPYHAALDDLLSTTHKTHGQILHLNMHSMSHRVFGETPAERLHHEKDIVIGDRNGSSCDPELSHRMIRLFVERGYRVGYNNPYKGAEIVKRYGAPGRGINSVQIEINKSLYVFERALVLKPVARKLRADLVAVITQLQAHLGRSFQQLAAD